MYSLSINQNNGIYSSQAVTNPIGNNVIPPVTVEHKIKQASFKGESSASVSVPATGLRTQFTTSEEQAKYSQVASALSKRERQYLDLLLKSGILLSTNSNDKSSTLDNLYKIITTPRAEGLDAKGVLKETIATIANPFIITQNFGDIPKEYQAQILQQAQSNPASKEDVINPQTINVEHSSACVSASIEFKLAKQEPAEFARFAQELTSPKMAVDKTIQLKNLSDKTLDCIWLLNAFKVPYEMHDFEKAKLTLAPDKNAYIRAQIQTTNRDYMERSVVDTLMQSTFMNVGSEQTYDALTDIRSGTFNWDNKGLIEFEKTFTESVVEDKNKTSVTYQILDENGKVVGHEPHYANIKKHILDSLKMGESVIIGYTYSIKNKELPTPDPNKKPEDEILSGHEITIIGIAKDKNGKMLFICNDTDDDNPNPIAYPEDWLLPKIHHAGLPQEVVANDIKYNESWVDGLNAYKEAKKTSTGNKTA